MDELDGDEFADFQTYNHNDVIDDDKQLANNKSETIFKQSNIYELDVFAFQEFVTNFEEQLIDMFQVDQTYQTVKSQQRFFNNSINVDQFNDEIDDEQQPMSPIHSQEDMINDCPIWYNLTGSYNCGPPLQFGKSETFQRYLDSLISSSSTKTSESSNHSYHKQCQQTETTKLIQNQRKQLKQRINERDLPANMRSRIKSLTVIDDLDDSLDDIPIDDSINEYNDKERLSSSNNIDQEDDERQLANDLDMHSLMIYNDNNHHYPKNQHQQLIKPMADNADKVIEEIENIMGNNSETTMIDNLTGRTESIVKNNDPLQSLSAATLLDAAIQSWKNYQQQMEEQDEEDEFAAEQFHSLPLNLGSSVNDDISNEQQQQQQQQPKFKPNHDLNVQRKQQSNDEVSSNTKESNSNTFRDKLSTLTIAQLNELYMELEQVIQLKSESLIHLLATRDELEFEKELKNQFISLLLSVQNKRRYLSSGNNGVGGGGGRSNGTRSVRNGRTGHQRSSLVRRNSSANPTEMGNVRSGSLMSRARIDLSSFGSSWLRDSLRLSTNISSNSSNSTNTTRPVYLTTVIPYRSAMMPLDIPTLQMLIKLLTALNENSNTVPALLTEYILKVICP